MIDCVLHNTFLDQPRRLNHRLRVCACVWCVCVCVCVCGVCVCVCGVCVCVCVFVFGLLAASLALPSPSIICALTCCRQHADVFVRQRRSGIPRLCVPSF